MITNRIDHTEWHEASARFRFAGMSVILLATMAWLAWFYPYDDLLDRSGAPLGGDYAMLYVAGQTVAGGEASSLYDDQQNQARSHALFPSLDPHESWPYRYPPAVAACMVPLSLIPFWISFCIFLASQCSLLFAAIHFLRLDCVLLRSQPNWVWAIVGCPLIAETLIGGQSSLLALFSAVGFFHYYRKHNDIVAGSLLALALYKPNVLALVMIASLVARPRLLLGFIPTTAIGFAVAISTCGMTSIFQYLQLATQLASSEWSFETPYFKVHGLAPLFQWLAPEFGRLLCVLAGLVFAILIGLQWRTRRLGDFSAMALLLAANSLFNPYVPIYDLVLLIAALVFASEAASRKHLPELSPTGFQFLAVLVFLGPHISQSICRQSGLQLFPVVCLASLVLLGQPMARKLFVGGTLRGFENVGS